MWERHLFTWVYTDTTSATCPSQTGSLATTPITLATVMCDANEPSSVNTAYGRLIFDNVTSEYDSTFTLLKLCFQLRILEMTDVRQCSKVDIICLSLSSQNTLNFALYFSDCELLAFLVHSESKYTSLCSCGSAVLRTAHVCCSVSRHKQRSDDHAEFHDVHTSKWLGSKAWATHPCSVLYELKNTFTQVCHKILTILKNEKNRTENNSTLCVQHMTRKIYRVLHHSRKLFDTTSTRSFQGVRIPSGTSLW